MKADYVCRRCFFLMKPDKKCGNFNFDISCKKVFFRQCYRSLSLQPATSTKWAGNGPIGYKWSYDTPLPYPIGSMGLVYLPTFTITIIEPCHVGKYSSPMDP